jgi:hypothetical protein
MVELGELIGGIMSGLTRARRDADVTAALVAEEYRLHSLLGGVSAPRIRLSEVTIELPVIISTNGQKERRRSGPAMTHESVNQALQVRLDQELQAHPISSSDRGEVVDAFAVQAEPDLTTLFGDDIRGISGEAISRIAQRSISTVFENRKSAAEAQARKAHMEDGEGDPAEMVGDGGDATDAILDAARAALDLEARRIGRELTAEWPMIEVVAETQAIKDLGSEVSITRIKLKLIEEGLEWTSAKDEQGNRISRLMSE